MDNPLISIAVCTYNRTELLPGCLQSLAEQTADPSVFQVIVVNNNSTDDTQVIAERFAERHSNFQVVVEAIQGLSNARNRGYLEANGRYVAYMDDDAKAPAEWIEKAIKIIDEFQPDIFGGPIYPFYITPKPDWFQDKYQTDICSEESGWLGQNDYISGSNIFIKKEILDAYGGFKPNLGMTGNTMAYGEETAFIDRARADNRSIYYSRDLIMTHLVVDYKMSLPFFIYHAYLHGLTSSRIWPSEDFQGDAIHIISHLEQAMNQFKASLKERDPERYPYPENYAMENALVYFNNIGRIVGSSKLKDLESAYQDRVDQLTKEHRAVLDECLKKINDTDSAYREQIQSIYRSPTYKIGRWILLPVRAVKKIIKMFRPKANSPSE